MKEYYGDFHIHLGSDFEGNPIKITASRNMTIDKVLNEALYRKGLDIIALVDCGSPYIIRDLKTLLIDGLLEHLEGGGYSYQKGLTVLLAAEVEIKVGKGNGHFICYMPHLESMEKLSQILSENITNVTLSTQMCRLSLIELHELVSELGGTIIPAHVFTPHKSLYGSCVDSFLKEYPSIYHEIYAVELGLSADAQMASHLSELQKKSFLSNSDAHSVKKIAREYNRLQMGEQPNFEEFIMALKGKNSRGIIANYGMDPRLGKYHRTLCHDCSKVASQGPTKNCPYCESSNVTIGVWDRLKFIEDAKSTGKNNYVYHIPLEFIPKLGPKTYEKLIKTFGTEMSIIHEADYETLKKITNEDIARIIIAARNQNLQIDSGGGGVYGKVKLE